MTTSRWTTPTEFANQLRKHWESGRLLAAGLTDDDQLFPLKLRSRNARSRDLDERFDQVRQWVGLLKENDRDHVGYGYEIHWRRVNHRTVGANDLPARVIVPSREDALKMIGKTRAAAHFDKLASDLLTEFPELQPWLIRRSLEALNRADEWPRLKTIMRWFRAHPRPDRYLRQLDIPGVDTKFIHKRRQLVTELLDQVLPETVVDPSASGARQFNQRFGLKSPPPLVRFRILDPSMSIAGLTDLSVIPEEFASLSLAVDQVFITENDINGLAFPDFPRAIVIFGLGYGLDRLATIGWLRERKIWYWGDIDTHGFAILNRLRHYLPEACSFLMDRATLDAHRDLCGQEPAERRFTGQLTRLTSPEQALFETLRDDLLGERIRLEQERIGYAWLENFLDGLTSNQA